MMQESIPGILKKSGDEVIKDLVEAGLGVNLDLNQVSIEKINNISYGQREASFAIKALELGKDGSPPYYKYETNVIYDRFIGDNYFSKYEYHINLDAPFTLARVVQALNEQTPLHWDVSDFSIPPEQTLVVSSVGKANIPASTSSKRLYLEIGNSGMSVVITPVGRLNIARLLPPSVIRPPEEYFDRNDTRVNLSLRLPDANGVIVADELQQYSSGEVAERELDDPVKWLTLVYGMSDGLDVVWVQKEEPQANNFYGAEIVYNGLIAEAENIPAPYNQNLDHVLVFRLSDEHCTNYTGHGIVYYNLSRVMDEPV